jgi:hypothetical protein
MFIFLRMHVFHSDCTLYVPTSSARIGNSDGFGFKLCVCMCGGVGGIRAVHTLIPALRRLRLEDHEFKASLGYKIRSCPKK